MNTPYPIVPKKVGPDCCIPGSCQGIIDLVAANIEVQPIVGMHGINGPSSKPTNPDPAVAWINDADGQLYIADVTQSKWKREHPVPPGSGFATMWTDTESKLWEVDGGDGTDPSVAGNTGEFHGSFWKVDHRFDGRSPMGQGNIPGDPHNTVLHLLEALGAGSKLLTAAQLPDHPHDIIISGTHEGVSTDPFGLQPGPYWEIAPVPIKNPPSGGGDPQEKVDVIHPVLGVYFIVRTARRWITIDF